MASPSTFVCYRRADEPFAAALSASMVGELVGAEQVFIDTLYLRQRGPFAERLLAAVRGCTLVLAVIGSAWDSPENRARLADPADWVRRELVEASGKGIRVVPVLVGRPGVPSPPFDVTFDDALVLDREDVGRWRRDLSDLLGVPRPADVDRRERVERAALAMLRHVLPPPQRSMANDLTVARCVAAELGERDWLRFVTAGNLPQRPSGSAVVYLTQREIGIAQLAEDLTSSPVTRLPVAGLTVGRTDRRRLGIKPVSDLDLTAGGRSVTVKGIFAAEADELLALAGPLSAR